MYKCQSWGTVMDRDENGAQKIFLWILLDRALIFFKDYAENNSNT